MQQKTTSLALQIKKFGFRRRFNPRFIMPCLTRQRQMSKSIQPKQEMKGD
ncbi:hypothetical protein [Serratia quinivorans]